eukprot:2452288-Pleurochrysis_carterae.AAC.1
MNYTLNAHKARISLTSGVPPSRNTKPYYDQHTIIPRLMPMTLLVADGTALKLETRIALNHCINDDAA